MSSAPVTLDFSKAQPIDVANIGSKDQPVTLDFSQAQAINPGEQINDTGNRVIVPAEGESFASTLQRAAAYGKTVTPDQINREVRTMPGKVATVLGAAPVIGAAIPAAMAGVGELTAPSTQMVRQGAGYLMQQVEQEGPSLLRQGAQAVARFAAQHKITTGAVGLAVLNKMGIHPMAVLNEFTGWGKATGH